MRMRKKKNGESRLLACSAVLAEVPKKNPERELWLELGAGKGSFAIAMAKRNPEVDYYAMERVSDCVTLAAEAAVRECLESGSPTNLKFIVDTADNLSLLAEAGSVSRIFLNFSDPWSKKGYAKRRLTHRRYISLYLNLLSVGGKLRFKTDNIDLFEFTLEEIAALGITPDIVTRDLHASEYEKDNIHTEYEDNFSAQGYKINMVEFTRPDAEIPEIPAELSIEGRREAIRLHEENSRK